MTRPHHYVHCDVPEGMTLAEYRTAKSAPKSRKGGLVSRLRRRARGEAVAPAADAPRRLAA